MVCRSFKKKFLTSLIFIGLLWIASSQAFATGLYDMSGLLRQGHPFDVAPPAAQQPRLIKPAPIISQRRQASPTIKQRKTKRNYNPLLGFLSEIRFGVLAHDYGPFSRNKEDGYDLNAEFLFASPAIFDVIWAPRPHVGITRNSEGRTSTTYAGLTWDWRFWQDYFFEFAWGASRHNGNTTQENVEFKDLGCKTLFREALELGYRMGKHHALSLHFSHISNAKLCDKNEGLETFGLRYGYRF